MAGNITNIGLAPIAATYRSMRQGFQEPEKASNRKSSPQTEFLLTADHNLILKRRPRSPQKEKKPVIEGLPFSSRKNSHPNCFLASNRSPSAVGRNYSLFKIEVAEMIVLSRKK